MAVNLYNEDELQTYAGVEAPEIAATSKLGVVKIDDSSIKITNMGTIYNPNVSKKINSKNSKGTGNFNLNGKENIINNDLSFIQGSQGAAAGYCGHSENLSGKLFNTFKEGILELTHNIKINSTIGDVTLARNVNTLIANADMNITFVIPDTELYISHNKYDTVSQNNGSINLDINYSATIRCPYTTSYTTYSSSTPTTVYGSGTAAITAKSLSSTNNTLIFNYNLENYNDTTWKITLDSILWDDNIISNNTVIVKNVMGSSTINNLNSYNESSISKSVLTSSLSKTYLEIPYKENIRYEYVGANGNYSHIEGQNTSAEKDYQSIWGNNNFSNSSIWSIGGNKEDSNLLDLDDKGNLNIPNGNILELYKGNLYKDMPIVLISDIDYASLKADPNIIYLIYKEIL